MFTLIHFVLALGFVAEICRAATATPVGCVDLRLAPSGGKTVGTPGGSANCMSACAGYSYFYWQESGDYCYCLNSAGTPGMYVRSAAIDDRGTCASNYAAAFKLGSTFALTGCYGSVTGTQGVSTPAASSPDGCFSACARRSNAAFQRSSSGYTCTCFDVGTLASDQSCGTSDSTFYVYQHSLDARASGLARRGVSRRQQLRLSPCPNGGVECPVPGVAGAVECIDVRIDPENCGGCVASEADPLHANSTGIK